MTWEEHRSAAEEFALIELWEQAAAHYVNAAALLMQSKRLEDTPEITYLQLRAGQAFLEQEDPTAAEPILNNALQLATLIEYTELLPEIQRALGEAHATQGNHLAAIPCFEAALGKTLDPELYLHLTLSQLALGQEPEGLKSLERACKIHYRAKNLEGMVTCVSRAAAVSEDAGYKKLARSLYKKALQLAEIWPQCDPALQAELQARYDALGV